MYLIFAYNFFFKLSSAASSSRGGRGSCRQCSHAEQFDILFKSRQWLGIFWKPTSSATVSTTSRHFKSLGCSLLFLKPVRLSLVLSQVYKIQTCLSSLTWFSSMKGSRNLIILCKLKPRTSQKINFWIVKTFFDKNAALGINKYIFSKLFFS